MPNRCLGKLAPQHDPRRLMLGNYIGPALPAPPGESSRTAGIVDWGMYLNDKSGDCTVASPFHGIMSLSAMTTGTPAIVPDPIVLAAYEVVCPTYVPSTGAGDDGALIMTVNALWAASGLGGNKITGYAGFDVSDPLRLQQAVFLCGGANIGIQLPRSAMEQTDAGQPWTVPWFSPNLGGHCVWIVAYDAVGPKCVTWGQLQKMTWEFFLKYCDEAYAVLDPLWFALTGLDLSPSGLNVAALGADLAAFAA